MITGRTSTMVLTVALLTGCSSTPDVPTGPRAENFQVFASLRSFDPPGRIYRVQPDGQVFGVTKLEISPQQGVEEIPKIASHANFSLKEVLDSIGVAAVQLPASANAEIARKRSTTFEGLSASREFLDDAELDRVLPNAFVGITVRPGNKYYVIRETIASKSINYKMDKSWIVNAGLEAEFRDAVKSSTNLDWDSGSEFSMNKQFDQPMRIWYKAEQLQVKRPLGVGPAQPPEVTRRELAASETVLLPPDAAVNP